MNISQIYVYLNKEGELLCKTPYIDTGCVRQGDDFILNVLMDYDATQMDINKPSFSQLFTVMFKIPTETKSNLFPFLSYDQKYVVEESERISNEFTFVGPSLFTETERDLSKFGIIKDKKYNCWSFNSSSAYNGLALLTNLPGNLEVQLVTYQNGATKYSGVFKIFIEKTLHYESPFDVKQMDLDRFTDELIGVTKAQAQDTTMAILPPSYVIEVEPNTFVDDKGDTRTESLTLKHQETVLDDDRNVILTKKETQVEMPLPIVTANVTSSVDIEEENVNVTGTGKNDNPLNFSFSLHKGRDGYGIHCFYIDNETGNLIVKAERSDDLVDGNYTINENGELVINL